MTDLWLSASTTEAETSNIRCTTLKLPADAASHSAVAPEWFRASFGHSLCVSHGMAWHGGRVRTGQHRTVSE
jgi:hypothetical protein